VYSVTNFFNLDCLIASGMNGGLTGMAPAELKELTELQYLNLSGTALNGSLSLSVCVGDFNIAKFDADCAGGVEADVQCSCCTVCCGGIDDQPHTCGQNPFTTALSVLLLEEPGLDRRALSSPGTPQYQALIWLVYGDPAILDFKTTPPRTILERYVIATLYYSLNGPEWKDQRGFLSDESVCKWSPINTTIKVVSCNEEDEFVVEIHLSEKQLTGKIPRELGLLTSLTFVDLSKFLSLSLTKCILSLTFSISILLR
jgi:hypothetical protein